MYKVKQTQTPEELAAVIELRYRVLRAPWNQPKDTASDALESSSINAFIANQQGQVIACGRLQENEGSIGQIRYMAVDPAFQGQGLGKLIVLFLEEKARELNLKKVELQARENAVEFYKASGYQIAESSFLLWGIIQHYRMEKSLS